MNAKGRKTNIQRASVVGPRRVIGKPQIDALDLDVPVDGHAAWTIKYYIEKFRHATSLSAFAGVRKKLSERIMAIEK